MANPVSYRSKLINAVYYIKYNAENDSAEGLTGEHGITNAKFIRDYLLTLGWRKAQIVGAVCSAQRWASMNPAKGFPDATTGGFWNKSTQALRNVWRSHYGTATYGYGDAPLLLLTGHVNEGSGFNCPYAPNMTWQGFIRGRISSGWAFYYFWHGYVMSGLTSVSELDHQYAGAQGRYWERILFGTGDDDPDPDPDNPPTPDPDEPDDPDFPYNPTPNTELERIIINLLLGGHCAKANKTPHYLRGDWT